MTEEPIVGMSRDGPGRYQVIAQRRLSRAGMPIKRTVALWHLPFNCVLFRTAFRANRIVAKSKRPKGECRGEEQHASDPFFGPA